MKHKTAMHEAAIELKRLGEVKALCAKRGVSVDGTIIYLESKLTADQVAKKLDCREAHGF